MKILDGSEPKAEDIVTALGNMDNEDTGVSEAISCAACELDWSDVSDIVRERTECQAVTMMYHAPAMRRLLAKALEALNTVPNFNVDGTTSYRIAAEIEQELKATK